VIQGLATLFKETQNYRVSGVCNNGNALRELVNDDKSINTIFIDLKLPKTNIYRLLKDLIVLHSDIRIIVFSGYTLPKLVQDIMELGIHAYISKKSTLPQILDTVERVHNGEHFIGSSVYQKESKNEIEDNNFILDEVDTFVKFAELTVRELDVIILLSRGYTNKEIASKLILSKYTIETHRKNIMKKFKLKTTGQLIYYAAQRGIV
jgi:DNA-binding NarL/FixJ family response regulator